jgi:hypothetical protein
MNKKTLVLGASAKPSRFSYLAINKLVQKGIEVVALGAREEVVAGVQIVTYPILYPDIHTVSLYLSPRNLKQYIDYIIQLKPKRIIFNPGTENQELFALAKENGIETLFECTLVMLSTGNY